VALGAPLVVRMFVPLWVVNASPLPASALVVALPPPAKAERERDAREDALGAEPGEARATCRRRASPWWPTRCSSWPRSRRPTRSSASACACAWASPAGRRRCR